MRGTDVGEREEHRNVTPGFENLKTSNVTPESKAWHSMNAAAAASGVWRWTRNDDCGASIRSSRSTILPRASRAGSSCEAMRSGKPLSPQLPLSPDGIEEVPLALSELGALYSLAPNGRDVCK